MFKVDEFSFFKTSDVIDVSFENNWSRCYEYAWVLNTLYKNGCYRIHNTSCGGQFNIHNEFKLRLLKLPSTIYVLNSDIEDFGDNYIYDINDSFNIKGFRPFNATLNVSAIEHIKNLKVVNMIKNLVDQTVAGGKILITFDYPDVDLSEIENIIDAKCDCGGELLNGENSVFPDLRFKEMNVIKLELTKT